MIARTVLLLAIVLLIGTHAFAMSVKVEQSSPIFTLPVEVVQQVASFCDWQSIGRMQRSCSFMRDNFFPPGKEISAKFCFKYRPNHGTGLFAFLAAVQRHVEQKGGRNPLAIDLRRNMLCSTDLQHIIEQFGQIGVMHQVVDLNVASNRLHKVPSNIGSLSRLQSLSIWENCTSPGAVALIAQRLPQLTAFSLGCNNIIRVPEQLAMLTNLRELSLSGNTLESKSLDVVSKLPALRAFYGSICYLWELPPSFAELRELRAVELSINHLNTDALRVLCFLTKLELLNVAFNRIDAFPPEMVNLRRLQTLRAEENSIESSSIAHVCRLPALRSLNLDSNGLATVTHRVSELSALNMLSLMKNNFTERIRQAIRNLLPKQAEVLF